MPIDPRMVKWDESAPAASGPTIDPRMVKWEDVKPEFEDPGALMTGVIGAGRATDQLVKGVQQLYYKARGDQKAQDALAEESRANDAAYAPLKEARPWATGIGEAIPDLALMASTRGSPTAVMLRSAGAAAAPGALKYGTFDERASRALIGGLGGGLGAAGGMLFNRVLQPAGASAVSVGKEAIEAANRVGYKPTAAQITQSPALANFENFLAKNPGSAGVMQRAAEANQTALNTAGARAMGETASDLGEGTFKAAEARIGGEFSRLGQVTQPNLGNNFLNSLAKIDSANAARGPFRNKTVDSLVDKGLDLAASGKLSGTAYKEIRTELANAAQAAYKAGDATTGRAYKDVVAALDDAAKGSLSKADQEAWDAARQQWSAFKTLSKGNVAEAGNVSAPRVASVVRRNGPGLRTGNAQGDIADIARVGEAFKGVQNPNSGGMVNQLAYQNVLGPLMMAGNRGLAGAYMSPIGQRYMANGLLNVGKPGEVLLSRGAGLLGAPAGLGLLNVE